MPCIRHAYRLLEGTVKEGETTHFIATNTRYEFLGDGDWKCSRSPVQQPFLPACLNHDVAYSSLRKFIIVPGGFFDGQGIELDEGLNFEEDSAWNPRNKHVADLEFHSGLMKIANTSANYRSGCQHLDISSSKTGNGRAFQLLSMRIACEATLPVVEQSKRVELIVLANGLFLAVNAYQPPDWHLEPEKVIAAFQKLRFKEVK